MSAMKQLAEELNEQLHAHGFQLGGECTLEDLQNYLAGEPSGLFEFANEVMTKEAWMKRYAKRMVDLAAATPDFAEASAEAAYDVVLWALNTPEETAEAHIGCWGE